MAKKKRPSDTNQRAKSIVDLATGESEDTPTPEQARSIAAQLGRLGGLKGGKARAASLSAKRRSEIAKAAAKARWHKKD